MTFMNPFLLFAALGIGLPIFAHLFNRYQVKRTDWAAMQFLNRSVRVRSRQLRLKDLLLLLLRCLAILLLALAISKPAMTDSDSIMSSLGEPRTGVIIALDTSYSMGHSDGDSTRFDRALDKLEELADNIHPGAPVSMILLGNKHKVIARNMAFNRERFTAVLQEQKSVPEPLKLETVPSELSRLVSDMEAVRKEIYIVTDVQAGDWADPAPWLLDGLKELNQCADTFIVPIQGTPDNLSITDFELFSGLLRKGTVARYQATVANNSPEPVTNVRIKCLMDDINVDSKTIPMIGGGASQTVSFFVPFHNAGSVKLVAQLDEDALPLDNTRRSVAGVRERISILCVEGGSSSGMLESFVAKALRARGEGSGKEEFKLLSVSWLSLPSQELDEFDVVVLSDVPEITSRQAQRLRDYVKAGNGLIWFGGDNVKVAEWNKNSAVGKAPLLPASIGNTAEVRNERGVGQSLNPILPDHPVCRPLRSLPKDLFSETQFYKIREVKPLPNSITLLSLSGSAEPVVIEQSIGRGHVFMFTTSSDRAWNNMALTPVFPMLLQQMVTYVTGRGFGRSQLVGDSLVLRYKDRPDASDGVFETPAGEVIKVPVREYAGQYVALLDYAAEAGFYDARVSVQSPGMPIAVNVNPKESDVRCLDPADAQSSLNSTGVAVVDSSIALAANMNPGYEYGRPLLIFALAILIIESLFASSILARDKTGKRTPTQTSTEAEGT